MNDDVYHERSSGGSFVPSYLAIALEDVLEAIERLKAKAEGQRAQLERLAKDMPEAMLLMTVPAVGVLYGSRGVRRGYSSVPIRS